MQGAEVNGGRDDGRVQASTDTLQRGHAVVDNGRLIEFGLFVVGACAGATVPAYCACCWRWCWCWPLGWAGAVSVAVAVDARRYQQPWSGRS